VSPITNRGVASGLNTCFQLGAALGVAIVTTVAVSGPDDYLEATPMQTGSSR
jgi:hypothetical protein